MPTATPSPPARRTPDTAGLEVALVERALADGGLCFVCVAPGARCFYRLTVHPTLFGGFDLGREWGLLAPAPTALRRRRHHYASLGDVAGPLEAAVRARLRGGYRASALPGRFVPSAPAVYWCPAPC